MAIGKDLLNAPLPEMLKGLGVGIAEAQHALDKVSLRIGQQLAGMTEGDDGKMVFDDSALFKLREDRPAQSLLSLGFTPTFYQFVDTIIEVKMAVSMSREHEVGVSVSASASKFMVFSASVNASYSQKYQYSAEGSSLLRTKLVTVPAPPIFEQQLKEIIEDESTD